MHPTDHISDDQLNEYLDDELTPDARAYIESHSSMCADCATRLSALRSLFTELESLPDVELTRSLTVRLASSPRVISSLPRWLTLTAAVQIAVALIVILIAAPFVSDVLPPLEAPSLTGIALEIRAQWVGIVESISSIQIPALPAVPALDISSMMLSLTLAVASLLWLVGNGLLLRKQS